jgi:hypothetical protein
VAERGSRGGTDAQRAVATLGTVASTGGDGWLTRGRRRWGKVGHAGPQRPNGLDALVGRFRN